MAKRRAEAPLLHSSLNKRYCAPLSVAGGPPSFLALQGHRNKKRPLNSEDEDKLMESTVQRVTALGSLENEPLLRDRHCSVGTCTNKRLRRGFAESDTNVHIKCDKVSVESSFSQADGDTNAEDGTFNSFQYWRVPLPELDLSLLEDEDECQTKDKLKVKDSSFDTMET
uniref:Putative WW-binding domain-containing protein n=1 Tax=Gouania willdenowi TaxID=441366 RepID=A0A8C5DNZ5_GOUWI